MWRASLETLDFLPLTTVDYSGGIIITDWYFDNTGKSEESIKISIRFLSNIHFSAMVVTNMVADSNKKDHKAAAYTAFASYATAVIVFKF